MPRDLHVLQEALPCRDNTRPIYFVFIVMSLAVDLLSWLPARCTLDLVVGVGLCVLVLFLHG